MRHVILCAAVCLLAGCGSGPSGSPVTGKVTFTDGAPLPRGVVTLNGPGGTYSSVIGADGSYTMESVPDGKYNVAITGAYESDVQTPDQHDAQSGEAAPVETTTAAPTSLIPDSYADPEMSGLTVTVPSDDYTIQVEKL
jgi:hypothetical protein